MSCPVTIREKLNIWGIVLTAALILQLCCVPAALAEDGILVKINKKISHLDESYKFEEALLLSKTLEDKAQKKHGQKHNIVAYAINLQGYFHQKLVHLTKASKAFERSLKVYKMILPKDSPTIATIQNNLAFSYAATDRLKQAETLYKRSLSIRQKKLKAGDPLIALSLNNIAQLYKSQGRLKEAIPLLHTALAMRIKFFTSNHRLVAESQQNLAGALEAQGRFAKAKIYLEKALITRKNTQLTNHPEIAGVMSKIGQNLYKQKKYRQADRYFKKALTIRYKSQNPNHSDIATSLRDNAKTLYQLRKFSKASTYYSRALKIFRQTFPANHPNIAETVAAFAESALAQGHTEKALALIREAVSIHTTRDKVSAMDHQHFMQLVEIAWRRYKNKKEAKSYRIINEMLVAAQYATQSRTSVAVSGMAARFAAQNNQLQRFIRQREDLVIQRKNRENALSKTLAMPLKQSVAASFPIKARLKNITTELGSVNSKIRQQFPKYFALIKPKMLTIADIQKNLTPEEALVNFLTGNDEIYLWVITQDRFLWKRLPISVAQVKKDIAQLRQGLETSSLGEFNLKLAHHLYRKLLLPAEEFLKDKPRLIVVASGPLTGLPLQLLLTRPAKRVRHSKKGRNARLLAELSGYRQADWLIKRHALSVLPSINSFSAMRELAGRSRATKALVGFANPDFRGRSTPARTKTKTAGLSIKPRGYSAYWRKGRVNHEALRQGLPPLPGTETELRSVAKTLSISKHDLVMQGAATETAVKNWDLSQYRIIYFATHGLVAGEISGLGEPALVFSLPQNPNDFDDGLLTASEVSKLRLDADWVVLSACNTAAGNEPGAEALSGLARAFFHAGTRALLVSHWRIGDRAAAQLTSTTFQILQQTPHMGRAKALQQSMLSFIKDKTYPQNAHPALWAPFSLVGSSR